MIRFSLAAAALAATLLTAPVVHADDDPNDGFGFTVQGRLVVDGTPLDLPAGTEMTFTLWETIDGNSDRIGQPCTQMVPIQGGLFSALVDVGDRADGLAQWLQIEVDPDGEAGPLDGRILTPRRRLQDVPTAEFALEAAPGPSIDPFGDVLFDRRVGVNVPFMDPDPFTVLEVGGRVRALGGLEVGGDTSVASDGRLFIVAGPGDDIALNPFGTGRRVAVGRSFVGPSLVVDGNLEVVDDVLLADARTVRSSGLLHIQTQGGQPLVLNTLDEGGGDVRVGRTGEASPRLVSRGDFVAEGAADLNGNVTVAGGIFRGGTQQNLNIVATGGDVLVSTFPGGGGLTVGNAEYGRIGVGIGAATHRIEVLGGAYCNGRNWLPMSDAASKHLFEAIDAEDVLARLAGMPVQLWTYREDPDDVRHLGPTAQDFMAAFGLGDNDRTITPLDADGVAFASIQALLARVEAQDTRIAELEAAAAEHEELRARLERLETLIRDRETDR